MNSDQIAEEVRRLLSDEGQDFGRWETGPGDNAPPASGLTSTPEPWAAALRYRELFDFAPDGYLVTDLEGVIVDANHAAVLLLQTRKGFLCDKPLPLLVCADRRADFYALLIRLRQGGIVRDWYAKLQPSRSQSVEVWLGATAIVDEEGRVSGIRWLLRNVTPGLAAENALRAEREFTEGLLDAAQAAIGVLDDGGRILRSNLYLRRLTGSDEARGRRWEDLLPEEDRPAAREMLGQALAAGVSRGYRGGLLTCDGSRRSVVWTARALAGDMPAGVPRSVVLVVGHDITELQEAQRQAELAERLATIGQVMASLAHESRNMLQRGQGCLERLSWRLQDRPEELELVARAQQAQRDLAHLLDDVRAYAAHLKLDLAPCDVRATWREAWTQVMAVFPGKQAVLREDGDHADPWCVADRFRLLQVFRNLLENSFAACERTVRVEVCCRDTDLAGRRALQVTFRDNGPGFQPEQRVRLFEPFYTTRPQGSGLGMVNAYRILEAHGGTIAVGDNGPPGAEIIVTLPRDGP
jgi:PAS domain S-box-containing protein